MIFCTTGDSNYLLKGLALLSSLKQHVKEDFILYWLCIDDQVYDRLQEINDPNVSCYRLSDLEKKDPSLEAAKNIPPSNYGSQRDNYIWSLTPYFINYLLNTPHIPGGEFLIYCDNDIYFYKDPRAILDVIGEKHMGIHTHRFPPTRKKMDVGTYNVGVTIVKKSTVGLLIANLWKEWVHNPSNPFYEEYGRCGDQGYLVPLTQLYPSSIRVFDEGSPITHLAPWCPKLDGRDVLFFHFSHFNFDLQTNTWRDSNRGEWHPTKYPHIVPYYERYFNTIRNINSTL